MDAWDAAALAGLGLLAGLVGGLLGIAGSILMIPGMGMLLGGTRPGVLHLHQAAAMLVNVCVVLPAVMQHRRARAILPEVVRWTIPGALAGAAAGVILADAAVFRGQGQGWLQLLFAGLMVWESGDNVRRLWNHGADPLDEGDEWIRPPSAPLLTLLIGVSTGMLGGLLGVGGGLVAVPMQQYLLRMPLRRAIANSAATIVFSAAVAAAVKNASLGVHGWTLAESAELAAWLAPTALLGGWVGGGLVHRWPVRHVRAAFVLVMGYAAARMIGWGVANLT